MVRETRHLWVGNLPDTTTVREDRLRDHFKRSTEDVSPSGFDQRGSSYYDRSTRSIAAADPTTAAIDQYPIRRPNNYHTGDIRIVGGGGGSGGGGVNANVGDARGRARDRLYRNGPYSSLIDRTTTVGHHRVTSWYDSSPNSGSSSTSTIGGQQQQQSQQQTSSSTTLSGGISSCLTTTTLAQHSPAATRSIYGNIASAVVQPDNSTYDLHLLTRKKKSRSGSESPCGGGNSSIHASSSHSSSHSHHHHHLTERGNGSGGGGGGSAASSRSHSRSPSSCSSTNSTSSNNSHTSSPLSQGSDHHNHHPQHHHSLTGATLSSSSGHQSRTARQLQSAVSAPSQSGMTISNNSSSNNNNSNNNNNKQSSTSTSATGNPVVHSEDNRPLAICVRNLPARSSDTSLKDGLFHEYKKHGKVTWVKVVGQNAERYALVCFKKPDDVEKALEVSHDKLFFGCKIEVAPYQGYDVEDNEFRPYEAELDEYHPKSTRTLFIGNLEKDITGSELRKHFECFGEIIEIDIKKQGLNAYAFCQYSDIVSVVKAMRKMDGEHLGNNRIKLGFGKSMPTNCVWIDGIADSVSENHLSGQFSRYGPVSQVVIDRERKLALVSFDQIQYAQSAVKEMRGATLRGRKLQVDFASRECQEAFYDKLEKQTSGCSGRLPKEIRTKDLDENAAHTDVVSAVPGTRFSRYDSSQSRSRASSFSRHNNMSGTTSPAHIGVVGAGGNSTATVTGPAINVGGTTPRGGRSKVSRHGDYEYSSTERRFRSYDEYSQGSAASHDDESFSYSSSGARDQRSDSPLSRLGPVTGIPGAADSIDVSGNNNGRRRCDKSPGDIRNLQKERFHLLEQLEECPSSGDELVSPKKRMKFDHSSHHHNHHHTLSSLAAVNNLQQHQLPQQSAIASHPSDCSGGSISNSSNSLQQANLSVSDAIYEVLSTLSNDSSALHHRKCVEVRRLSECSSLKYASQLSNVSCSSRRPSTESGGAILPATLRHTNSTGSGSHEHGPAPQSVYATPHSISSCKRRRTGSGLLVPTGLGCSTNDPSEHHSSRGRGHQLHSHHSHEASGGESADGSRPGTPLCDERPEVLPSEPRRIPRDKPNEPMMLPLPKFGIAFFLQHRAPVQPSGAGALSSMGLLHSSTAGHVYNSSSSAASINQLSGNNNSNMLNASSPMLLNSSSSHSSLSNTLSSPPLLVGTRLSSASFHHQHHHPTTQPPLQQAQHHQNTSSALLHQTSHHHHHSATQSMSHGHHGQSHYSQHHHVAPPSNNCVTSTAASEHSLTSPLRSRSLSSNSSDSEAAAISNSPSIEERIKTLDEMFEIWSGGGASGRSLSIGSECAPLTPSSGFSARHKFLDLDVKEVKPSEIVKSVLAKKSIFDDDLQRLKNINDKYEPADFSNLNRSTLSSSSPGIPNLAATKTAVVGSSSIAPKSTTQPSVFQSPGVSQLQRLNSPMNSPLAMSPYNSPSPSPVVTSSAAKSALIQPQPAKSLQYPFPSHPPLLANPVNPQQPVSTGGTTPLPQSQTIALQQKPGLEPLSKPKIIPKSLSMPEKSSPTTNFSPGETTPPSTAALGITTNRVLQKSASVPGSTNIGTVKPAQTHNQALCSSNKDSVDGECDSNVPNSNFNRSTSDTSSNSGSRITLNRSTVVGSKKSDKSHRNNNRNEEKKLNKAEKSLDKRSMNDDTNESLDSNDAERLAEVQKRDQEEKDRIERDKSVKEKVEKERLEKEKLEKEERERVEKEKQEHERVERQQRLEKEKQERRDRERKQRELEAAERERKEREDRERRDKEERERKEREEQEKRAKEEKERREREERERREREERDRRERDERERRERDLKDRRDKEERDAKERKEREERERPDQEEREREIQDRKAGEEQRLREAREKVEPDAPGGERLRQEPDEQKKKKNCDKVEESDFDKIKRSCIKDLEENERFAKKERHDDEPNTLLRPQLNSNHKEDKYNKETSEKLELQPSVEEVYQRHRDRNSSGNSPTRITKRRLSSQESTDIDESVKRIKVVADNRKILDRRDSKDPSKLSKHHKSHTKSSSLDEKLPGGGLGDERYRKDSGFEEKKNKDKEHKKHDKEKTPSTSHKYKKHMMNKEDKEYSSSRSTHAEPPRDDEMRSSSEKTLFDPHDLHSTDEEEAHQQQPEERQYQRHKSRKEHKEKRRHTVDEEGNRIHGDRERRQAEFKRHENNRQAELKSMLRADDTKHCGDKLKMKTQRKLTQSSNDSDSDEPKKHSIFDIMEDGPYVSMYDKVKARSCKNMQKQEEEKKIKAKFSQLKQSRAKREGKKRSTSYDGDSDSDFDDRHGKYKHGSYKSSRGSGFMNSSSDEGTIPRQRESVASDSDSDVRRARYNRARLNELCDGDSSEGCMMNSQTSQTTPRRKISSKRNSRIASDSSDGEPQRIKNEPHPGIVKDMKLKAEIKLEDEEVAVKSSRFAAVLKPEKVKSETITHENFALKMEIKSEPREDEPNFLNSTRQHNISESEGNMCSSSAMESKDSIFEQLFSPETRKKRKKSKKRQKFSPPLHEDITMSDKGGDEHKSEKHHSSASMEHVFDELKRESVQDGVHCPHQPASEKKKHKDRKEKKREKFKDDGTVLTKEERHRLKKSKKASKTECERAPKEINAPFSSLKRSGEKMEDIFGPISDEESQMSTADSIQKNSSVIHKFTYSTHTQLPMVSAALIPFKQEPLTPKSHTVEENEENKQKASSYTERERHRKEKREKKRKERERNREQHALATLQQKIEDENSVDLDEAGRALEAQLMEDSDNKLTEETTPSTARTQQSDMNDVFRFSDGDENSVEISPPEKREQEEAHKIKEKKKKKKRSKEERHHQKREHHHHHSHNNHINAESVKLSIDVSATDIKSDHGIEEICKPSPSLPCLLDDSPPPPRNNLSSLERSMSPVKRDSTISSLTPKTPSVPSVTVKANVVECKKKFIPGFDVELDEKISESAVQSISAELTPLIGPISDEPKILTDSSPDTKNADKLEEKSRVIISQEETEDAVAALLGESFGTSEVPDYSFNEDPCDIEPVEEEALSTQQANDAIIPEEDAEEMRKAVQSLSNEDIDMKPDTPQSEHDLQIDTDTEEPEDENSSHLRFDNPPKTPDIDLSQIKTISEDKKEMLGQEIATVRTIDGNKTTVITKSLNEIETLSDQPKITSPSKNETKPEKADTTAKPAVSTSSPVGVNISSQHSMSIAPTITRTQVVYAPQMITQQKLSPESSKQPQKVSVVRQGTTQFVMQPPTISIPEQSHFIYPPVNVMVSPRSEQHRMQSPQHQQSTSQPTPTAFGTVRSSSPHSPKIQSAAIRGPTQLSPAMPQHVVIQQRQIMSPPSGVQGQQQTSNISTSSAQANIMLNRLPITPVLAPISKAMQSTSTSLPQPQNVAKANVVEQKEGQKIGSQSVVYQSVRIGVPTQNTSGSPSGQSTAIKVAPSKVIHAGPGSIPQTSGHTASVKSIVEGHTSHGHAPQIIPVQVQTAPKGQTVLLQSKQPAHLAQQQRVGQQQINQVSKPGQQAQQLAAQSTQPVQQHHILQQRQHQIHVHPKQISQHIQQHPQQILHVQKPSQNQQQAQRISHQQIVQMQPFQASATASAQKLATAQAPLIQTITGKDSQGRVQQNIVVVRQGAPPATSQQQQQQTLQSQIVRQTPQKLHQTQQPVAQQGTTTPIKLNPQQLPQSHSYVYHQQSGQQPQSNQHPKIHHQQIAYQPQPVILQQHQPVKPMQAVAQSPQLCGQPKLISPQENASQASVAKTPETPTKQPPAVQVSTMHMDTVNKAALINKSLDKEPKEIKEEHKHGNILADDKTTEKIIEQPVVTETPTVIPPLKDAIEQKKESLQILKIVTEPENVSVIKSQNQPSKTEGTPPQPIPKKRAEEKGDIKSESNEATYWVSKEIVLDSVIKKVDAIYGNDTVDEEIAASPASSELIKSGTTENELAKITSEKFHEGKSEASPSINHEQDKDEETHDEDETEDTIAETSDIGKSVRGAKRGRKPKKLANSVESLSPITVEGVQTRRGKTVTPATRGRGRGRGSTRSTIPVHNERKPHNTASSSDQDIYEFHDDSGDESTQKSSTADRPRLILTIKSPVQTSTSSVVQTKPATEPAVSVSNSSVESVPQSFVVQAQAEDQSTVQPKDNKDSLKEEFPTPSINTRKSRRLQEKDGSNRSSVDDIIEDVVRNSSTSPKARGHTPPRRSTRNAQNNPTPSNVIKTTQITPPTSDDQMPNTSDGKKSPRTTRRSKDRKGSETSVDSSHEKCVVSRDDITPEKTLAHVAVLEEKQQTPASTNPVLDIPVIELIEQSSKKATAANVEKISVRVVGEPIEPMTLIDPVTGVLTVVKQSNEGQYVPIPGDNAARKGTEKMASSVVNTIDCVARGISSSESAIKENPKSEAGVSRPHTPQNSSPHKPTSVLVTSSPQSQPTASTPVHVSQPQAQSTTTTVVPQIQQAPQIRTHPLKAHVLNSQNKPIPTQGVVKVGSTVIGQFPVVSSPNAVKPQHSETNTTVQTNVIRQPIQNQPQPSNPSPIPAVQQSTLAQSHPQHLVVNIPHTGSAHSMQISATHSPRMQTTVVKQTQQQQSPSQPLQAPQAIQQVVHVVTKPGNQPQQIIAGAGQHQPVVIHGNKIASQQQSQYATIIVQGGKIVQQSSAPVTIQSANKHITIQHEQQPSSHLQKPISQGVSVVTHQMTAKQGIPPSHVQHPATQLVLNAQQPQQSPPAPVHLMSAAPGSKQITQNIHLSTAVSPGIVSASGSQHIIAHAHQNAHPVHQPTGATLMQAKPAHQQQVAPPTKGVIGLHQAPQIMTGAVASPPLKQPHLASQQPIVTGASSLRTAVPPISPQGQARAHILQPGLPVPAFEAKLQHEMGGYNATRSQSPPPAHQQASPITPGEGTFSNSSIRGVSREHFVMYQQYLRAQEALGARIPYIPRSPLLNEQKEMSEVVDESLVASPPLELRRPGSGSRTIAVPHSLQSPQDRATDSPQVAQVYVHGTRIPHPHYPDVGARYYENVRQVTAEPPPAHRSAHSVVASSPSSYVSQSGGPPQSSHVHIHSKSMEREQRDREREQGERDKERISIPGHTMQSHGNLVPAMPGPTGRNLQVATPPHGSQVPPQADSLLMLLQRYPVMWQGLLALKTDQAAVQMHFVFGNPHVARGSLPCNSDGTTPPLRIAQRMRLEQTQLEGVAKKMQYANEHCMLLALPCGRDHMDVLQQSRNLQTGFITYLQQKMAAGIVNIPVPGSEQAAYVVHIFPSCDFANENLERAAPDLKHRVAEIAHLLIVIATV